MIIAMLSILVGSIVGMIIGIIIIFFLFFIEIHTDERRQKRLNQQERETMLMREQAYYEGNVKNTNNAR